MDNARSSDRTAPSLLPGVVLLVLAAILIVVVLIDPPMAGWLRISIAVIAVVTVVSLLGYALWVLRAILQGGKR